MDQSIHRFSDAAAFLERVRPLLMCREAENNLMLGIIRTLIDQPDRHPKTPYLASVLAHLCVTFNSTFDVTCLMRSDFSKYVGLRRRWPDRRA